MDIEEICFKSNIVAIIPARANSISIHKKNIIDFCGKPLIAWTIEHALKSKYVNEVFVSTDSEEIGNISKQYGAKIINRPDKFSTDTSSSEEALLHAISEIEKYKKIDIIIFLQATSPLRENNDIDKALKKFFLEKADSLFSGSILEDFTVWKIDKGEFKSMTFNYKDRGRRQDRDTYYLENGSIYIFKPEIIKKYENRFGGKITFYPMPLWQSYEIDCIEDLEICEYYKKNKILNRPDKNTIIKNVKLIVYDFDGVFTDNRALLREDGLESVTINRSDGLAVNIIKSAGIEQIILTTETNRVVEIRANKLGIHVIKDADNKKNILVSYCQRKNIPLDSVVYLGNDLNDLEVMKIVGHPICPSDAYSEIRNISQIILSAKGGEGVARELIKYLELESSKGS